jgi:lipopolysaccharide/colanic/teichoic acid biosynthesis glycosyltransferase
MAMQTSLPRSHRVHSTDRPNVLAARLFRRILVSERRRADRANQPFVLLVVAPRHRHRLAGRLVCTETLAALTRSMRETDIVGWLEHKRRIGVILHDIAPATAADPAALELRIRRELVQHIDPPLVARVSIQVHVHRLGQASTEFLVADDDPFRPTRSRLSLEMRSASDAIKRLVDIAGSLTLLVVLLPLFALIAALVKLKSPGPIFFGQMRIGRQMKPFRMLKFRTMHVNADPTLHQAFVSQFILAGHGALPPNDQELFKIVDDPRVTSIGRVLRRASLDELPQLLNVLRGDMSLVGPRPPLPYEVEKYKPWHTRRVIDVKPGLTGLWQVGGRSRTTFDDMVRLDLQYAQRRSLWTDVKILIATPRAVFSGNGAC